MMNFKKVLASGGVKKLKVLGSDKEVWASTVTTAPYGDFTAPAGTKSMVIMAEAKTNGTRWSRITSITVEGTGATEVLTYNSPQLEYSFTHAIYAINFTGTSNHVIVNFTNTIQSSGCKIQVLFLNKEFDSFTATDTMTVFDKVNPATGVIDFYKNGLAVGVTTPQTYDYFTPFDTITADVSYVNGWSLPATDVTDQAISSAIMSDLGALEHGYVACASWSPDNFKR